MGCLFLLSVLGRYFKQYLSNLAAQGRHIFNGRRPDNFPVDCEVCMHSNVTKGNNIAPRDIRIGTLEPSSNARCCLPNYCELLQYRALQNFIFCEIAQVNTFEKALNCISRPNNVLQVELVTPHKSPD